MLFEGICKKNPASWRYLKIWGNFKIPRVRSPREICKFTRIFKFLTEKGIYMRIPSKTPNICHIFFISDNKKWHGLRRAWARTAGWGLWWGRRGLPIRKRKNIEFIKNWISRELNSRDLKAISSNDDNLPLCQGNHSDIP